MFFCSRACVSAISLYLEAPAVQSVRWAGSLLFAGIRAVKFSVLTHTPPFFSSDMKKVGVTVVGPQKKIVSSIKALETHTKNSPVPV